jgi:hypothetical protein
MPPTTENIPEKPAFDVYAMLLILSFFFLLGGTLLLNDDLDKNWGYWISPEARQKRAEHITEVNDNPSDHPYLVNVRELDLNEWKLASEAVRGKKVDLDEFPVKNFKWPAGYDPLKNPVQPGGADNLQSIPKDQLDALMNGYKGPADLETGGAAPSAPPTESPAPDAPKTEAPKTEAPKSETPPTN